MSFLYALVYPSQGNIAKKMGRSREHINRSMGWLYKLGFMIKKPRREHNITRYETKKQFKYYKKNRTCVYTVNPLVAAFIEQRGLRDVLTNLEGMDNYLFRVARISKKTFEMLWRGKGYLGKCHTRTSGRYIDIISSKIRVEKETKNRIRLPLVLKKDNNTPPPPAAAKKPEELETIEDIVAHFAAKKPLLDGLV